MTEEYNTVGDVEEYLLEFDEEIHGIKFSQTAFFIPVNSECCMEYLHRDGEIRTGTSAGEALARLLESEDQRYTTEAEMWDTYTGFFATREEAEAVRATYNGTAHYK